MKHAGVALLIVGTMALAGCGGSGGGSSDKTPDAATVWNQSDIVKAVGLTSDGSGAWTFPAGTTDCPVTVIMTTASQVSTYADAGDTVATNPARTAGVKITAEQTKTCQDAATKLLAGMK